MEQKTQKHMSMQGLLGFFIAIVGTLGLMILTGFWPFLDLGKEVVPVEQDRSRMQRELTAEESRELEARIREDEEMARAFLPKRDRTWARAKAEWEGTRSTQGTKPATYPITITRGIGGRASTLSGPKHEAKLLLAGTQNIEETLTWHLESVVQATGGERHHIAVEVRRSPRPLMLERVNSRIGPLALDTHVPPVTRYRTSTPVVLETYSIILIREVLQSLSEKDTVLTLSGDNRVKRKLLLPAFDCRWMLAFTNYR